MRQFFQLANLEFLTSLRARTVNTNQSANYFAEISFGIHQYQMRLNCNPPNGIHANFKILCGELGVSSHEIQNYSELVQIILLIAVAPPTTQPAFRSVGQCGQTEKRPPPTMWKCRGHHNPIQSKRPRWRTKGGRPGPTLTDCSVRPQLQKKKSSASLAIQKWHSVAPRRDCASDFMECHPHSRLTRASVTPGHLSARCVRLFGRRPAEGSPQRTRGDAHSVTASMWIWCSCAGLTRNSFCKHAGHPG